MVFSNAERVAYKVKHITKVFGGQAPWTTGDLFQHGCLGSFFSRGKIHIHLKASYVFAFSLEDVNDCSAQLRTISIGRPIHFLLIFHFGVMSEY